MVAWRIYGMGGALGAALLLCQACADGGGGPAVRDAGGEDEDIDAGGNRIDSGSRTPETDSSTGPGPEIDAGSDAGGDAAAPEECVYDGPPFLDPESLDSCASDTCSGAHCLSTALLPTPEVGEILADCDDGKSKCVPDAFIATLGRFLLDPCTSLLGAEGRCVSTCVPLVARQIDSLPQDDCAEGERCAPCYDPITRQETGACSQMCDSGPTDDAVFFEECCGGLSVCVPSELVPDDQVDLVDASGCQSAELCVPKAVASGDYQPRGCAGPGGGEARCLPACLPDVAMRAAELEQATCQSGELCAPCFDPLDGDSTGACELEGDMPANPPYTFPTCCDDGSGNNDLGTCVPQALVPAEQIGLLGSDVCSDAGFLCAPTPLADGSYSPESCLSLLDAEGRCLPACLPDVAAQADSLPSGGCAQGNLCVPCFDPFTGDSTGACGIAGDAPADPTPVTFDECCDGLSVCVPTSLVPADQSDLLDATGCAQDQLCAPKAIAGGQYVPRGCAGPGGVEARCLPACLPDVAARADQLPQASCNAGELCVPCFDPFSGDSTGACEIAGDAPVDPATTFPTCCDDGSGTNDLGTCVPEALVSTDELALLGQDTCAAGNRCAPTDLATGNYAPRQCTGPGGAEARCLPACLPDVAARADQLVRAECDAGELCTPCYDPFSGTSTGACELGGDTPSDPPYTFPTCCDDGSGTNDLGTCVPDALVPNEQLALLGRDVCDQSSGAFLCAPTEVATGTYAPLACQSWLDAEGRCLPLCLPDVDAQRDQLRDDPLCPDGTGCVPCYEPIDGTDTQACRLPGDAPVDAPQVFDTCCPTNGTDRGVCVPPELTAGQSVTLPQDSCAQGLLCAPTEKARDASFTFPSCTASGVAGLVCLGLVLAGESCDGACVPACIVPSDQLALLTRDGCALGERCAPCVDTDGNRTGACD